MVSVVGLFMASGYYRTAALSPMETILKKTSGRFRDVAVASCRRQSRSAGASLSV